MRFTKLSCDYYNALKQGKFIRGILLYSGCIRSNHPLTVKLLADNLYNQSHF